MAAIQMLPRVLPNLGEKAVGLTKEFWGTVLDRDDLREAGQAQQKKAEERIEQFRRELKADVKRGQAAADEARQKANQSKSSRSDGKSELEKTGPQAAASATAEKLKGSVKEAAGSVLGNDNLRREGSAQQDKAASEKDVAKEESRAEQSRAKANAAERQQRAAEG
jgi:uncharacterized protein YjbJ (UPF0337 family)